MDERLKQFEGQSYLSLKSFRRNGEGVQTTVWFIQTDETIYVRTLENSGKVKRIRNHGNICIAPCDASGKLLGPWVPVAAVEIEDQATDKFITHLLEGKYGIIQLKAFAAASSLRGWRYTILKITLPAK